MIGYYFPFLGWLLGELMTWGFVGLFLVGAFYAIKDM